MNIRQLAQLETPVRLTVAFDFDGTIRRDDGSADLNAISLIEKVYRLGYNTVVFTARPSHELPQVERFVAQHGVKVSEVTNTKPVACMYVDNRAVSWPASAESILRRLKELTEKR